MTIERLHHILDPGWSEHDATLRSQNPLGFPSYDPTRDSVIAASGTCGGFPVEAISFDFDVYGGSMGIVAGEKIARAFERACTRRAALIALCASGGARMQEGMLALSQMTKTVLARAELANSGLPFLAYLLHPTTGGVYASFASLADIIFAEHGATIGFAGPRVSETITGERLPEGSHTAEFAFENGSVHLIVAPDDLKTVLKQTLELLTRSDAPFGAPPVERDPVEQQDAWAHVRAARDPARPTGAQFLELVASERLQLGSDRGGIVTALARIAENSVVALAMNRTRITAFGYRKARSALELASRFSLPVVSFIDTPGADPSWSSEQEGIAREIALTFNAMLSVDVPAVAIVTGEGGSGGALALASTDRMLICQNGIFSVIAPEGAASILKRSDLEQTAAELRLTAYDLKQFGIADGIIAERPEENLPLAIEGEIRRALAEIDRSKVPESRKARWREVTKQWLDE